MGKKEFKDVPIRTIDHILNEEVSKFEIEQLTGAIFENQIVVAPHRHNFYHIMFIKKGVGEHSIDFKTYKIKPNCMFFVSPGQIHSLKTSRDTEGYVISFDSAFYHLNDNFQKLLDYPFFHSMNNTPMLQLGEKDEKIAVAWDELFEEHKSKAKDNLLRALFEVLLIRVARVYEEPITSNNHIYLTYQLRKLETLIDTYYKTHRKLEDYAKLMHISSKHLNSLCKKSLNKTVMNLIHERILIEAKRLLLFTKNTVTEIAHELGFTDTSYFMRFFKKHTSFTAEMYRNNFAIKG
ncbi:HTH araC/xylS-type domain-containing protein [Tenacibaculum sp. 190130A14a]|uniref:AraC family transcriptional regulator, transcriptional activator of pobA n=1 Tax=Tenacibaculum polynesiense TaxID=3137857 RepID=A0ABM9PF29_9FLAO